MLCVILRRQEASVACCVIEPASNLHVAAECTEASADDLALLRHPAQVSKQWLRACVCLSCCGVLPIPSLQRPVQDSPRTSRPACLAALAHLRACTDCQEALADLAVGPELRGRGFWGWAALRAAAVRDLVPLLTTALQTVLPHCLLPAECAAQLLGLFYALGLHLRCA